MAGVLKLTGFVVVAQKQRADVLTRIARLGESAHHELLPPLQLHLHPVGGPHAWPVG